MRYRDRARQDVALGASRDGFTAFPKAHGYLMKPAQAPSEWE